MEVGVAAVAVPSLTVVAAAVQATTITAQSNLYLVK